MESEEWNVLHNNLRDGLQNEIRLTRELLSNMHQEEVSLILRDTGSVNQILQMRSEMLEKLSHLRLQREKTTEKIAKIAGDPTEIMRSSIEEICSEILCLSDQLVALTERMNRQQTQNIYLTEHGSNYYHPQTQAASDSRPKRKASVATYHLKK